jgi:hypothetical protein
MASFARNNNDFVIVSGSVFRAIIDLARESPAIDAEVSHYLDGAYSVKGITLDLLEPSMRTRVRAAITYAAEQAAKGERSSRSGDDAASGDVLVQGAEQICALLDAP